jgi:hypothetical protein
MSAGFNPMVLSAQYSAIPDELTSSKRNKPIPLSIKTNALPSQSGTQGAGGQILFQLNSSSGFIKPGSVYMRCRISLVANGVQNGAAASGVAFGNVCRNASSIIDRFTVSSGAVLESINNYGSSYVPTLLLHASNQAYINGDDGLLECGKRSSAGAQTYAAGPPIVNSVNLNSWVDLIANETAANCALANTYIDVAIPLYSNLFQNEKAFPLALLSQNTLLQLDLATFGKAMYNGPTQVYSDFTVSNAFLVYDLITPSAEYLQMMKAELQQGMLYQMPFVSSLGTQIAKNGGTTTYNWGVGLSSLMGITYSCQVAPSTVSDLKYFISDNTLGVVANNNFRLFLDGQQQNSVIQDTSAVRFAEQQKVWGLLGSVERTSASGGVVSPNAATTYVTAPSQYETYFFVGGQNCVKINESMAMTGSQVNNVSFILETGNNTGTIVLANAWHQRILVVDGNGGASIVL